MAGVHISNTNTGLSAFAARQQRKLASAAGAAVGAAEAVLEGEGPDELNGASFVEAGKTSKVFRLGIEGPGDATAEEGEFSDSSPYEGRDEERGKGCVTSAGEGCLRVFTDRYTGRSHVGRIPRLSSRWWSLRR